MLSRYIVIDVFGYDMEIFTDVETGKPKIFYRIEDAQLEAIACEKGIIVNIDK